ncbi:MAG: alpha/beta fold hydrolase [Actinomycetia bacterium]|nr:alpha/beta fold hydrolase [Actinomycetes bacterium]
MAIRVLNEGRLPVGDGHELAWEAVGDVLGMPVVYLHGGPGSGYTPSQRTLVGDHFGVLFDQRGSGRSTPGTETVDDLSGNTTQHLIADIEKLRIHLGIERWAVLGLSWGTTLGLAYAQAHPDRVIGMVLGLVTTTTRREVDWITVEMGRIFPEAWEAFIGLIPAHLSHLRPVTAYAQMLFDPDLAVEAAAAWCQWEDTHMSLSPGAEPRLSAADPQFQLRFARLVTHYWSNAAFLSPAQLLAGMSSLATIPGHLLHGRHDISSTLDVAWRLHREWPASTLTVMEDAGHGGAEIVDLIRSGLDDLAQSADPWGERR